MVLTKLPTQLHVGPQPVRGGGSDRQGGSYKPDGALWTSTYETAWETGWPWWCGVEGYGLDRYEQGGWLLEPVECRVFQIDTAADARRFLDLYGYDDPVYASFHDRRSGPYEYLAVDWTRVAAELDAVRLTCPYDPEVRFGVRPFYGWDCESTAWLSWQFSAVTEAELPPLEAPSYT